MDTPPRTTDDVDLSGLTPRQRAEPIAASDLRWQRHTDADLVRYWNEGDGALSWLLSLERELQRRGYFPRATSPADGRPRLGGERVRLEVSPHNTPGIRPERTP